MKELGHRCEEGNGGSANEGPLNEYFPEGNFCAKPNGRRNQKDYPEKDLLSSEKTKSSRKDKGLNLRKSLAWNPAFFTEEGVLNPLELSKITGLVSKPSSRLPSKTNVESSSKIQLNKYSKRPPLKNLEENLLSKHQAKALTRSSMKKAPKLSNLSEASSHDETQMSMALQKSSIKGIPKNVPKQSLASSSLEKGKRKASTLKLNNCPLSTNRLHMDLNCSASTRIIPSVIEKKHNFSGLPPGPAQIDSRMPSSHEIVERAITMKPSTTKSQMQTYSGSSRIISYSQQKANDSRLPSPLIKVKPSALRKPSPSLGFFQQKKVTSSTSNQLHTTSHVPITGIPSLRKPTKLKHSALSKPSFAQTEQRAPNDSEACTKCTEIKHIDMKESISSNVCSVSNCLSDAENDIISTFSIKYDKAQDVFHGNPNTTISKELPEEIHSKSNINSNSFSEGSGMIRNLLHSNGFENTSDPSTSEVCSTYFEMHFPRSLDECNSKHLNVCAPFMNHDLILHMESGDEAKTTCADPSKESISSKLSDSISNLRTPCIHISEKAAINIEPKELPEVLNAQNSEVLLDKIKSQVQQDILVKISIIEEHSKSSQYVQPVASSEVCQPQVNLQMCELMNDTSFLKDNGKNISLDSLKQGDFPLKHKLNSVPYSEEWLASIENFGEKKVKSSNSNQLHKTSQVPNTGILSLRKPTMLMHSALSKPSVAQTEQQAPNDSEACTKSTEIKHINMKESISSNVCSVSNCKLDAKYDIINTFSNKDNKAQDVFHGKPNNAISKELPEEIHSKSNISSNSFSEGSGMIRDILHSNGFENTSDPITSEVSSTYFEMHFPRNLDEWNSKQLNACAPFMNNDLIMHMDPGDEPKITCADPSKESISSKLSDSVSNLRTPCIHISEKAVMHIEPKELPEVLNAQNSEALLDKINSQIQQDILVKLSITEEHAKFSQDVQLVESSEVCQPLDSLQMCELMNDTRFLKDNGKNISMDSLKQGDFPLKHQLNSVPYSEEWLAAIEKFGEDILAIKTGKVNNSPPDKAIQEPGPWSPVKRNSQDVGPFNCTKYNKIKSASSEE